MLQLLSAVAHAVACEPQAENCCSRIFCTLGPGQPYFWLCHLRYSQLVLNPAWLHGTPAAVLGGPPMVLTSLRLCRPHPSNFSWALFRDSGPATYAQVSVLLHEPFNSGTLLQLRLHLHWYPLLDILTVPGLSHSPWPLHALKISTASETFTHSQVQVTASRTALVPSGPQSFCVLIPRKHFPEDFTLSGGSLLSQLILQSQLPRTTDS